MAEKRGQFELPDVLAWRGVRFSLLFALCFVLSIRLSGNNNSLPVIPIHITLISDRPEAIAAFSPESFRWIAGTLDYEFRGAAGNFLAKFEIRSVTPHTAAKELDPDLAGLQDHQAFNRKIGNIIVSRLFQHDKLNIFIYHSKRGNMLSNGGYYCVSEIIDGIKQTDCFFRILLHWKALANRNRHVLVHEAGHAFGLGHVTANAPLDSPELNMMYAEAEARPLPPGEGGYYFTPSQIAVLKSRIGMMKNTTDKYAMAEN